MVRLTNCPTHEHHAMSPLMDHIIECLTALKRHNDTVTHYAICTEIRDCCDELVQQQMSRVDVGGSRYLDYKEGFIAIWIGDEKYTCHFHEGPKLSDPAFIDDCIAAATTMPEYQAALAVSGFNLSDVDNSPEPV